MRPALLALALLLAGWGGDDAPELVAELSGDAGNMAVFETVPTTVAITTTTSTTTTVD